MKNSKNKFYIIQIILISFLIMSCGSSEEDEYGPPLETAVPALPTEYSYNPPVYNPPNNGGGNSPIGGEDPVATPIPGDLPVGIHVIASATRHTLLYATNPYWRTDYYGTGNSSDLVIEQVYARAGDVLELNLFASIRLGERVGTFKQSCNNRNFVPLTVWVGNKSYTLITLFKTKVTVTEDGPVRIGIDPFLLKKKNKPCLVVENFNLKLHAN